MAKTLVKLGTDVCMRQYGLLMIDTPNLAEPIESHLKQSAGICEDIAYRSELMERDMEAEEHEMFYLFEWNNIERKKNQWRLEQYILKELKLMYIELGPVILSKDGKNIQRTCIETLGPTWSFTLTLDDASSPTIVTFKVFDVNGNERASKKLMVKRDHGSIFVYMKKKN